METIPWSTGTWTNPPAASHLDGDSLVVEATAHSDAWQETAYGFTRATENALVAPFAPGQAVEVSLDIAFTQQFDQGGVFVKASDELWLKAGIEFVDGLPHLGAVVTRGRSDWSLAPVPAWSGRRLRIRASWDAEAITLRAGRDGEPLRLLRLLPFEADAAVAGPYCASPSRDGLRVRFHTWQVGEADGRLHAPE